VLGAGGPKDDAIPAMLSNGEYVINAKATSAFRPVLDMINQMRMPRFANGGAVSTDNSRVANLTINNHGQAATVNTNPSLQRWRLRTLLYG
jgi:hypothetical protein